MLIQTLQNNWDYFAYFSKMIWYLKVKWHSVMYSCSWINHIPFSSISAYTNNKIPSWKGKSELFVLYLVSWFEVLWFSTSVKCVWPFVCGLSLEVRRSIEIPSLMHPQYSSSSKTGGIPPSSLSFLKESDSFDMPPFFEELQTFYKLNLILSTSEFYQ